jgi:hypothetical protein
MHGINQRAVSTAARGDIQRAAPFFMGQNYSGGRRACGHCLGVAGFAAAVRDRADPFYRFLDQRPYQKDPAPF